MPTHSIDLERGSTQFLRIADASQTGLDLTGNHTIEMWAKFESLPASAETFDLINKYQETGINRGYMYRYINDSGTLKFEVRHSTDGTGGGNVTVGQLTYSLVAGRWYHLAFAYSTAGTVVVYVNGTAVGTISSLKTSIFNNAAPLDIGSNADGSPFDGRMKHVRIFNDIRSASEILSDARTEHVTDGNLVAEWLLDGAYTDTSGNSNTLTPQNSPVFSVDIPWEAPAGVQSSNYGLNLVRASSQYVSILDASQTGLDVGSAGTFEAWVMLRSLGGGSRTLMAKYGTGSNADQRSIQVWFENDGNLRIQLTSDGTTGTRVGDAVSWGTFNVGEWFHLAWTFNAGTVQVFVNGVSIGSSSAYNSTIFNSDSAFQIGAVVTSDYFDGVVRDVRVFNDVRTQAEIVSDAITHAHVSDANLKGEWLFNNALTDGSGGGNTLTATNTPTFKQWVNRIAGGLVSWWTLDEASGTRADSHGANTLADNNTVTSASGKKSLAADFEKGNSEFLSIADGSQVGLDITGDITMACWFQMETTPATAGANLGLFSKGEESDATDSAYGVRLRDNGGQVQIAPVFVQGSNLREITYSAGLSTATWYHLVVVCKPASNYAEIYLDGKLVASGTIGGSAALNNSSEPFHLGNDQYGSGRTMDGLIDEASIYSRALEYGEVLDLYNAGNAITYIGNTNVTVTPSALSLAFSVPAYAVKTGRTVGVNPLVATFSLPSRVVSLPKTVLASVLTAVFSIPPYSAAGAKIVSPSTLSLTFSIPAYSVLRDFTVVIASALSLTFSLPSRSVTQGSGVTVLASTLTGTFTIPAYSVSAQRSITVLASVLSLVFSLPTLRKVGGVWQRTGRSTNADWTRVGRNSN